jgi:hypothetical protein
VYSSADQYLAGAIAAVKELNPNAQVVLSFEHEAMSLSRGN